MRTAISLGCALVFTLSHVVPAAAQDSAPASRQLQLSFHADGTVSLSAANVTVREILSEWARQCGCYVVNWDKMTGGPLAMPVQYAKETQRKVLESLLRQAAGYVLTPKRPDSAAVSNYETIYILATSSPVGSAYVPPPPAATPVLWPTAGYPDDEIPAAPGLPLPPGAAGGPPRPSIPTAMPGTVGGTSTRPGTAGSTPQTPTPTMPGGVTPLPPQAPGAMSAPMPVPIIAVPPPQER